MICACPAAAASNLPRISAKPSIDVVAKVDEILAQRIEAAVVALRKSRISPRISPTSRSAPPASMRAAAAF